MYVWDSHEILYSLFDILFFFPICYIVKGLYKSKLRYAHEIDIIHLASSYNKS